MDPGMVNGDFFQPFLENVMSKTDNKHQDDPSEPLPPDEENVEAGSEPELESDQAGLLSPNTTTVPRIKNN